MDSNQNNQDMTVTNNQSSNSFNSSSAQKKPSRELLILIAEMFTRWTVRYGNKMKVEDWGIDTVNDWGEVLTDLRITPSEFKEAKRKAGMQSWMISHPADFLALARVDPTTQYPDMRQAYLDMANQRTDCPIAHETARRVGFSQMRHGYEYITYPIWQKHYVEVCKAHLNGQVFKVPQAPQITHESPAIAADEAISNAYIASIRALLAGDEK